MHLNQWSCVLSHPLLTAPIGRSLLKLAGPTTAVMVVQTFVAIAETYFFGRLGTEALAGFALVFPFMMLMTMMAAGGMGGGVAAATARALGAGRRDDARALVLHALVLGLALALLFTLLAWTVGPALYRLLGGHGAALANAETYSHVLFSGSLYALALGLPRWIGVVTPLGGLLFIAGWAVLIWAARDIDRSSPRA